MADSLLDEALSACRDVLDEIDESGRSSFSARLGILERAVWSLTLGCATQEQVLALAQLVLMFRDEVLSAQAAAVRGTMRQRNTDSRSGAPTGAMCGT